MSDLTTAIQEERQRRHARVEECRLALEAAEKEEQAFLEEIGSAAGLNVGRKSIGLSREEIQVRRERVLAMQKDGIAVPEIAEALEVTSMLIYADLKALRKQGLLPESEKHNDDEVYVTAKQNAVRTLYLEGLSIVKIADRLKISRASVDQYLSILRKKGLLTSSTPVEVVSMIEEPSTLAVIEPIRSSEPIDDGDENGATEAELKAEVERQQNGSKSKSVTLATTITKEHSHRVAVDRFGDGYTLSDASGHVHRVSRFVVGPAHGHRHDLKVSAQ
jgi:transposase